MKNLRVRMKLIFGFSIVTFFALIVGLVGIFGMYRMNVADDRLYNGNYLPTVMAGDISQNVVEQRVHIRNLVIYDATRDATEFNSAYNSLSASQKKMDELLAEYKGTITDQEDQAAYNDFLKVYNDEWIPLTRNIYQLGAENKTEDAKDALTRASTVAEKLDTTTSRLQAVNLSEGQTTVHDNTSLFFNMALVETGVLILSVIVSVFMALRLAILISRPLSALTLFMNKAGTTGDITLSKEDYDKIIEFSKARDEVGQCIGSTASFINRLISVSKSLETVANGDLTADITLLSQNDVMGDSLSRMTENLNSMFTDIRTASTQVSAGAGQVSQGAQELASGSSEQAASIEEFSAALSELQLKTEHNAENSAKARDVNNETGRKLDDSIKSMGEMLEAMKAIDESSNSITKVIKVIDDIAFQTNILALNAAVEAARAGQHGKGFAVVADEVRNLASKSAAAAKETADLIEGSSERVREGNQIVAKTNADLESAAANAGESTRLIEQVAAESVEQARSIAEINSGIEQISTVVQANSATAEQSAAASEEMSAQAVVLDEIVSRFKLKGDTGRRSPARASGAPVSTTQSGSTGFALSGSKY